MDRTTRRRPRDRGSARTPRPRADPACDRGTRRGSPRDRSASIRRCGSRQVAAAAAVIAAGSRIRRRRVDGMTRTVGGSAATGRRSMGGATCASSSSGRTGWRSRPQADARLAGRTPAAREARRRPRRRDPRTACIEGASLDDDRGHVDRAALIGSDPRLPDRRVARHDLGDRDDGRSSRGRQLDRQHQKIRRGARPRRKIMIAQGEVQMVPAAGSMLARRLDDLIAVRLVPAMPVMPVMPVMPFMVVVVVAGMMDLLRRERAVADRVTMRHETPACQRLGIMPVRRRVLAAVFKRNAQRLAPPKRCQPLHEEEHDGDAASQGVRHRGVGSDPAAAPALGDRDEEGYRRFGSGDSNRDPDGRGPPGGSPPTARPRATPRALGLPAAIRPCFEPPARRGRGAAQGRVETEDPAIAAAMRISRVASRSPTPRSAAARPAG